MVEKMFRWTLLTESPSQVQTIQASPPPTAARWGSPRKGPVNVATLVTGFPQFHPALRRVTTSWALPIRGDGRVLPERSVFRAFINRVLPSDAVAAEAYIQSRYRINRSRSTGDGYTVLFNEDAPQERREDMTSTAAIRPSFRVLSLRWRGAATVE